MFCKNNWLLPMRWLWLQWKLINRIDLDISNVLRPVFDMKISIIIKIIFKIVFENVKWIMDEINSWQEFLANLKLSIIFIFWIFLHHYSSRLIWNEFVKKSGEWFDSSCTLHSGSIPWSASNNYRYDGFMKHLFPVGKYVRNLSYQTAQSFRKSFQKLKIEQNQRF